jgi:hypothetical protein
MPLRLASESSRNWPEVTTFCLFQTFQYRRLAIVILPDLHLHRAIATSVFSEHHQRTSTGANDGLARHPQHTLLRRTIEAYLRGQTRPESAIRIG